MKRLKDQRGSVTLWTVIIVLGLMAVVGLVVDGGAQLRATQKADQLAREAARAAAQQLTPESLLGGKAVTIDQARARQAASSYIASSDASLAGVSVTSSRVTVRTSVRFTPVLLSSFGVGSVTVQGEGNAEVARNG